MQKFKTVDAHQLSMRIRKLSVFSELTDQFFELLLVSPLLNFSFNEMYLSRVSGDFTENIGASFSGASARIELVDNPTKLPCVCVSVVVNNHKMFEGFLMNLSPVEAGKSVSLPFFPVTVQRNEKLSKLVKKYIETKFVSSISECGLTHNQFKWLIGISVHETLKRDKNDGITFTYSTDTSDGSCVHLNWPDTVLLHSWATCVNNEDDEEDVIYKENVDAFADSMTEYFLSTYQMDVRSLPLQRVTIDGVTLNRTKTLKMKVSDTSLIYIILKYIDVACVKTNHFLNPYTNFYL